MIKKNIFTVTFILVFFCWQNVTGQKRMGIASTPPMGWNSWHPFRENINEEKIKAIADAMVSSGMKNAGYEYVIIDDGWMTDSRDENGHIIVDSIKFPSGIKAIADYIHERGLKFGLYSSPGRYTCQRLMGSLGYEQIDANDYAKWGVDYLKYDWCNFPGTREDAKNTSEQDCMKAFELMAECLKNTGRSIVYSVHSTCAEDHINSYPWIVNVAHMHRTSGDIKDNWDRMLYCLDSTAELWQYAKPGFWNDPDMLEVGNTTQERLWEGIDSVKMNLTEYQTHFSMWCMVAAPLIAGNDLTTMKEDIRKILTNKEIIAINQDSLGKQGRRIKKEGDIEVWCKELSGNRFAVALLNRGENIDTIKIKLEKFDKTRIIKVRDVWRHKDLGQYSGSFTVNEIGPHETVVLLLH